MQTNGTMPVYTMRLAGYLMTRGFVLLDMKPNYRYPERNVFYFCDTAEIKQTIKDYNNERMMITANVNAKDRQLGITLRY